MPGGIVREGQRMVLPGVGFEIKSGEQPPDAGAGVAGWIGRANQGPLGVSVKVYGASQLARVFGALGETGNTMDGAAEAFQGGAAAVEVVRLGSGGAKSTISLKDGASADVLKVDAYSAGSGGNGTAVSVRANPDGLRQDLVVYVLGVQKETFSYIPGTDAAAAAAAAVGDNSAYITATKVVVGDGTIAVVGATPLSGGTNPTITNNDYGLAIATLIRQPLRAFGTDAEDPAIFAIVQAGVDSGWDAGRRRIAIVAEPSVGVSWQTRVSDAAVFNDPAVVFVGTGVTRVDDFGNTIILDGYPAAGLEAGRHSVLPLGRQLTMRTVPHANQLFEGQVGVGLDDDQLAEAVDNGVYVYMDSDTAGIVTVEGNTSFFDATDPPEWATSADIGWGKSRLVLTRMLLFDDIYRAWAPMIPDLTNNDAGRESIMREAKNIIEHKYQPRGAIGDYALTVSKDEPPAGDQATFELSCQTPDGLERMRLVATFRR